jgi:uncharacterized membrane protein
MGRVGGTLRVPMNREGDELLASPSGDQDSVSPAKEEALRDTGRILALSDGIFAFAMTLLVLSLVVPPSVGPKGADLNVDSYSPTLWAILQNDWPQVYGYITAFVVLSLWWSLHHLVFGYVKRYDGRLQWLNLMFLLGIAVTPFALGIRNAFPNTAAANELYGGSQALIGGLLLLIVVYATQRHRLVHPKMTQDEISEVRLRTTFLTVSFAATVPIAFLNVPASQVAWIVIAIVFVLIRRLHPKLARARRAMGALL